MAHQSLDHSEILNVRWATVDPNPMAQKREARKIEEQAAEAVRRALPEEFVKEIEGDPEAKRRKRIEGGFGLQGYEAPDSIWYARNRELEGTGNSRGGIIEEEENYLIDDAPPETQSNGDRKGILSRSTLAALQKSSIGSGGNGFKTAAPAAGPAGPLVGYGSDDSD